MKVMMVNYTMVVMELIHIPNVNTVPMFSLVVMTMMTIVTMIARKKKKVYFAKRGDDDDDDKCDDKCEYPYCEIHNTDCDLLITLCGGVLTDDKHATGEIVANHQFQFDKPPQKDALHKKGFSIVHTEGTYYLALDHKIDFWHCKVDDKGLYKIYDKSIGEQCSKIKLIVLKSDEKATFTDDSDDCDDDCKNKKKQHD